VACWADEDELDRRALWRLGSWGVRRGGRRRRRRDGQPDPARVESAYQTAAADLGRQAQQIQVVARETEREARRLASAIDTLNQRPRPVYTASPRWNRGWIP